MAGVAVPSQRGGRSEREALAHFPSGVLGMPSWGRFGKCEPLTPAALLWEGLPRDFATGSSVVIADEPQVVDTSMLVLETKRLKFTQTADRHRHHKSPISRICEDCVDLPHWSSQPH